MNRPPDAERKWDQRSSAEAPPPAGTEAFRLYFERSADALAVFDPASGRFIDCNQAAMDLMRCPSRELLLQLRPGDAAPPFQPDGRASAERAVEITEYVSRHGSLRFDWLSRRMDGSEAPVEVLATAVSVGERVLHLCVFRDVTDRKRMESGLQASELRWRLVFEQSPLSIQVFAPDGMTRQVNRAWERLFQMRAEDLVSFNILHDVQLRENGQLELIEKAFAGEVVHVPPAPFELRVSPEDPARGLKWIGSTMFPLIDAAGKIMEVVCVHEDTTERQKAREELEQRIAERTAELRQSEERLRTLVEHAPEAIVVFDGETGRFLSCNENAIRLYGRTREQLLRGGPAEVSPPLQPDGRPSAEAARERIAAAVAGVAPVFEWMHEHASGRLIPCEVRLVRLPGEGRVLLRGSVTDNTERKRRETIQRATFEISEAVSTTQHLESLYRRLHEIIRGLMPADNFYLALHDPVTDEHYYAYHVDQVDVRPAPRKMEGGLNGWVLTSGRALLADRASMTDPAHPWRLRSGTPSAIWLGVPLHLRGRTIGVMAVQDYLNEKAFGEVEKQILTFMAGQVAVAIDRKRREEIQRATYDISEAVNAAEDLDSLYRRTHEIVQGLMSGDNFYIALLDANGAMLSFPWYVDEHNPVAPLPRRPEGGLTGHVLRTRRPQLLNRISARPDGIDLPLAESGRPYANWLGVPLSARGQTIGVMAVQDYEDDWAYGEEEKRILVFVAEQVAAAIERRRAEQTLRESEEKFRAIFEASIQGKLLLDEEKVLQVNPAAVRILGFDSAVEIVGHHPAEFAAPVQPGGESSEAVSQRFIRQCLSTGTARFEWVCLTPAGREIPIEVILTRVQWGGRQLIQAVIDDITRRKTAEAELLRALAREKELGQLKTSIVSMVSHEFGTPLGIIMSSAEILQDYLDDLSAEERRSHLQSIHKNTRRMAELMEEVLLLGRFEAGRMHFEPAAADLGGLAARVADEVSSATGLVCPVELRLEGELAGARADERLLRHVFINLLSNAVKYSEPGVPVAFTVRREGYNAVCQIRDCGIGVPEEDRARLFQAFQRGRNVGQRPGTGLGLVIVKRCIELHGGHLEFQSRAGEGTVVTVTFLAFL